MLNSFILVCALLCQECHLVSKFRDKEYPAENVHVWKTLIVFFLSYSAKILHFCSHTVSIKITHSQKKVILSTFSSIAYNFCNAKNVMLKKKHTLQTDSTMFLGYFGKDKTFVCTVFETWHFLWCFDRVALTLSKKQKCVSFYNWTNSTHRSFLFCFTHIFRTSLNSSKYNF